MCKRVDVSPTINHRHPLMPVLDRQHMGDPSFGNIHFGGTLRPSQVAASSVIKKELEPNETA